MKVTLKNHSKDTPKQTRQNPYQHFSIHYIFPNRQPPPALPAAGCFPPFLHSYCSTVQRRPGPEALVASPVDDPTRWSHAVRTFRGIHGLFPMAMEKIHTWDLVNTVNMGKIFRCQLCVSWSWILLFQHKSLRPQKYTSKYIYPEKQNFYFRIQGPRPLFCSHTNLGMALCLGPIRSRKLPVVSVSLWWYMSRSCLVSMRCLLNLVYLNTKDDQNE